MKHYLKAKDGEEKFEFSVDIGCGHPDMDCRNSTESVGCDGHCEDCGYSVAKTTIPVMLELLKRANCVRR